MRPRKLTVGTTFPIFPPRGGGQQRAFGLYGALARLGVEVDVVALVDRRARGGSRRLAPGLREIRVPKTPEHEARESRLHQDAGVPVTDIVLGLHHDLTPQYADALGSSARDASAVVSCHPFPAAALAGRSSAPLIYEAQDVEADLKAAMLGDHALVDAVRELEAACCERAAHVAVCSAEDGARLGELYGVAGDRIAVVANGVDPEAVTFTPLGLRGERKRRLGLDDDFIALFVGSWHEPNVVAARDVAAAALDLPEIRFLIVGGVGVPLAGEAIPPNVDVCGVVDRRFIASVLGIADAALNPMRFGSGTNLKMLDYALAGVPVLASATGARGLGLSAGEHYLAAEADELAARLRTLRAEAPEAVERRVRAAHAAVSETYAWPAIARRWLESPHWEELSAAVPA